MKPQRSITWPDEPRTFTGAGYVYSIWETACRNYRIDHSSDEGTYQAQVVIAARNNGNGVERTWEQVGGAQASLADAMNAINEYHCTVYKLILG